MASIYGPRAEETIKDETWITEMSASGLVLLTKDSNFKHVDVELKALVDARARVFCLGNQQMRGDVQVLWFLNNMNRIVQRCRKPGPFIYIVRELQVEKYWP